MKTTLTDLGLKEAIFCAEQECQFAHRKLGIKKQKDTATRRDYLRAEQAAKKLDKLVQAAKHLVEDSI